MIEIAAQCRPVDMANISAILVAPPDTESSTFATIFAIVTLAAGLPAGIGLLLFLYRNRFRSLERQIEIFAAQFDGRTLVEYRPFIWAFDEATAQEIAWRHGYRERPLPFPRIGKAAYAVWFEPIGRPEAAPVYDPRRSPPDRPSRWR